MNKEMIYRLKIAGQYQRKAIHALFPEEMGAHLDTIERELRMMVMEAAAELLKDCHKGDACRDGQSCKGGACRDGQSHVQESKVKKVDIVYPQGTP